MSSILGILLHDFCHRRLLVTDPLLSGSSGLQVFAIAPRMAAGQWRDRRRNSPSGVCWRQPRWAHSLATSSPAGRSHNAAENIFSRTLLNNDYRYNHKFNKKTLFSGNEMRVRVCWQRPDTVHQILVNSIWLLSTVSVQNFLCNCPALQEFTPNIKIIKIYHLLFAQICRLQSNRRFFFRATVRNFKFKHFQHDQLSIKRQTERTLPALTSRPVCTWARSADCKIQRLTTASARREGHEVVPVSAETGD